MIKRKKNTPSLTRKKKSRLANGKNILTEKETNFFDGKMGKRQLTSRPSKNIPSRRTKKKITF